MWLRPSPTLAGRAYPTLRTFSAPSRRWWVCFFTPDLAGEQRKVGLDLFVFVFKVQTKEPDLAFYE